MPDEPEKTLADDQSGAGYGNNALADEPGEPGEAEKDAGAHPS